MAKTISIGTDTPIKSPTAPRAGLPKIRWAPGAAREVEPRASWRSPSIPIRWLRKKLWMSSDGIQSPPPELEGTEEFARLLAS
eukprot:1068751-Pyramimonas_sp.AAC.1